MQQIARIIEDRRKKYAEHPFIQYLRDESRSPEERLAYAPYAAHFILTFSDFNRHYLHSAGSDLWSNGAAVHAEGEQATQKDARANAAVEPDSLRSVIDEHAEEDARHYSWFLQDLKVLGYDEQCSFPETLRFLWSSLGRRSRDLGYYAIACVLNADSRSRLAIIETMEAMGNVWLDATLVAARRHPAYERLIYFGQHHMDRETGHAIGSDHAQTAQVDLGEARRDRLVPVVHGLFDRMEAFNAEILARVHDAYRGVHKGEAIAHFMKH